MTPDDASTDDLLAQQLRRAVALPDAPPAWLHAALALWPAHGLGLAGALRRVLAAISFDSQAALPGVLATRSGGKAGGRHLLFSAEGRDIDLRVTPSGASFGLSGQVLGPDEAGLVQVWTSTDEPALVASGPLNDLGEFSIAAVAPGSYHLLLRLGSDEVLLPPVALGEIDGGGVNSGIDRGGVDNGG